jgi:outer membrane lipoprotein-sorting protein
MKSILSAIAVTVALCFVGPVEASAQVNEILKRMDTHYKALQSLRADVSRTRS